MAGDRRSSFCPSRLALDRKDQHKAPLANDMLDFSVFSVVEYVLLVADAGS